MHLLIWKKMKNARALLLFQEWSLYYYRSLFKEAFSSLDIRHEDCMRQVSLSHATGRRHAWVTYLRTVFRSRQECERDASSALNEFSSSPRAGLLRRVCASCMHKCVCVCVRLQACRATDEHSRWWRTVNAERDDYPLLFRYRTNHFLLEEFIPDYSARFFSIFIRASRYQRWSVGDTLILRQRKSNTHEVTAGNYSRPSIRCVANNHIFPVSNVQERNIDAASISITPYISTFILRFLFVHILASQFYRLRICETLAPTMLSAFRIYIYAL